MSKNKSLFSRNLKKYRKERGLSQRELAELSGLTLRMISYYENEASKPPIDNITAIAKALNVRINDLIGKENDVTDIQDELSKIDARTLKKIKLILSLTKQERHIIYSMAETFLKKRTKLKNSN